MGIPANAIAEAVFARNLSALKDERVEASKQLVGPEYSYSGNREELIDSVRDALYCSKICAYAQGFQLMRAAESEYKWKFDFASIAAIWRGGCIIRARFLQKITDAYKREPRLVNLLLDPVLQGADSEDSVALAFRGGHSRASRHCRSRVHVGAGVLRWLPVGTAAGKFTPGAARLFRRAHLRTHRSAARQIIPFGLAGTGSAGTSNREFRQIRLKHQLRDSSKRLRS